MPYNIALLDFKRLAKPASNKSMMSILDFGGPINDGDAADSDAASGATPVVPAAIGTCDE